MAKFTRRIKGKNYYKSKLTRRNYKEARSDVVVYGGASSEASGVATDKFGQNEMEGEDRKGVIDMISERLSNAAKNVVQKAESIALDAIGLEKKQSDLSNVEGSTGKSGILSTATNLANKVTGSFINNANEVLASDRFQEGAKQAAENTAAILSSTAENFNKTLNDPIVKEKVKEALDIAGEYADVLAESMEEPVKKAATVFAEVIPKATGAAVSGAIKVGTDALAAVPGVGSIVEVGKMVNDVTKSASAVVEAGSQAVETGSDLFLETKQNFKRVLSQLEEKKRMAQQISNRTTKSMDKFSNPLGENPLPKDQIPGVLKGGANRTRKRLFKNRRKSKRVMFAF
jgi:hypothetical protein